MDKAEKREYAQSLLREKQQQLGRLPKRSDFSSEQVCLIKQKLGPWPRALEAAGLKLPPAVSAGERSAIKRKRSRLRRKQGKEATAEKPVLEN